MSHTVPINDTLVIQDRKTPLLIKCSYIHLSYPKHQTYWVIDEFFLYNLHARRFAPRTDERTDKHVNRNSDIDVPSCSPQPTLHDGLRDKGIHLSIIQFSLSRHSPNLLAEGRRHLPCRRLGTAGELEDGRTTRQSLNFAPL